MTRPRSRAWSAAAALLAAVAFTSVPASADPPPAAAAPTATSDPPAAADPTATSDPPAAADPTATGDPPAAAAPTATSDPPDSDSVEVLVVTASATPRPLDELPGTIDIVSRDEIELRRDLEVADALRAVTGLYLGQPGGRGGRASLYLRGLDPNQTIVMLDGIRVNDPNNNRGGSFDLTTLDVESIERIEIVRGPLSSVHGADAMAGAVNILTRGGRGPDAAGLEVSGGRYGQYRAVASLRGERGPLDAALSGGWVDTGTPESESRARSGHAALSLGARLPGDGDLRGTFRYLNADLEAFPDDSGGVESAVFRTLEERDVEEITAGLRYEQAPTEWLAVALSGSYYRRQEHRTSPGVAPGVRDPVGIPAEVTDDLLDRYTFRARGTAALGAGFSFVLGGDVYHEDGRSDSLLAFGSGFTLPNSFDLERVVGGPFAELHYGSAFGFTAEAAVRVDFTDESGIDPQVMPRVGASYRLPWVPVEVHGAWGQGFKLPSFFALGNPTVGNPDLDPERSVGFDAGLRAFAWEDRIRASVAYFQTTVKDQIDFEEGPPPRLVNRSEVRARGVEFALSAAPHETVDLSGGFTFTDTDIRGTDEELRNRPRWRGQVAAAWRPLETLRLSLTALFVGSLLDSSIPTGDVRLDAYTRVDFATSWDFCEFATLTFAVDNLLDQDYEEAVGFPSPGVNPRVGIVIRY